MSSPLVNIKELKNDNKSFPFTTFYPSLGLIAYLQLKTCSVNTEEEEVTDPWVPRSVLFEGKALLAQHAPFTESKCGSSERLTFFPALSNTCKLVVFFPKFSQFLTLLLQFIF